MPMIAPSGRLTQKIELQPNAWASTPPIGGPDAAATDALSPIMPNARPRRPAGNTSRTRAAPFGKINVPASACCTRKAINQPKPGATAHPIEAAMNHASPTR